MRAILAGAGAAEALAARGRVEILASFPKALYVATPGGIAAFVAPGVHLGPLHVLLDAPPTPAAVRLGLGDAATWRGALPGTEALAGALPLLRASLEAVAAGNLIPAKRAAAALRALDGEDLAEVGAQLGGAGPGLTPAGDDALGGILLARRALGTGNGLEDVARGVQTTAISAAFLLWAARGQALAPVHDLLAAAVAGDAGLARSAARALEVVGHSSGADFAWGLLQGLGSG